MLCAASNSPLGAAQVLAPPAAAMRDAILRAVLNSSLGAALLLAPLASAMRRTVQRVAYRRLYSRLGAARVLASSTSAMSLAVPDVSSSLVPDVASNSSLGAALLLACTACRRHARDSAACRLEQQ